MVTDHLDDDTAPDAAPGALGGAVVGPDGTTAFDLRRLAVPAYGPALLFGAAQGALTPVIPATATARGAGVALAAFVVMLLGFGSLVSNLPASWLTDRYGERRALQGAGVVASCGALICLLPGLASLMLGVTVVGMASSIYLLARQKYLTEAVAPTHRARALSLLGGVGRIGMFVGPLIGAGVIVLAGSRAVYALAVVLLVASIWCASQIEDLESSVRARGEARVTTREVFTTHRRVFVTVGVGVLLVAAIRATRQVVIPLWCTHIGLDESTTSLIYAIAGGVDMLVFYPAGKLMDVRGRAFVAVPSMMLMAASLAALPFTHAAWSALLASSVLGFGNGNGNGIGSGLVMTLGADFSPDAGRAAFLGIWRQLGDTGSTLGPLGLSGLTASAGLANAVFAGAALGVIAAAVLAYWPARLQREGWGT